MLTIRLIFFFFISCVSSVCALPAPCVSPAVFLTIPVTTWWEPGRLCLFLNTDHPLLTTASMKLSQHGSREKESKKQRCNVVHCHSHPRPPRVQFRFYRRGDRSFRKAEKQRLKAEKRLLKAEVKEIRKQLRMERRGIQWSSSHREGSSSPVLLQPRASQHNSPE